MKIIQSFWTGNKNGSSVKCADTFRIAFTEKRSNSLNKNIAKTINCLFYYQPLTWKTFLF